MAMPSYSMYGRLWGLDPGVTFLNHGSFGACPHAVLEGQRALRDRLESNPVQFFKRDLEPLLDDARNELAAFLGADFDGLAFVPNATSGVNAVLRSLRFDPGDEVLTTTHAYNACRNALSFVAERAGARVVEANIPFPVESPTQVREAVLHAVSPRTRVALLDHVASPTGLRFPIEALIRDLSAAGVETLVDGAHAPGMIDLNLQLLGATYYVGNCHKWLCAPKGAAFLVVSPHRRTAIHPVSIGHGANSTRTDRGRFRLEFDWTGTWDPSACLSVPMAIRFIGSLLPGGWKEVRERNRSLVLEARRLLCHDLGVPLPCPDEMVGSLAALPLPDSVEDDHRDAWKPDPIQEALCTQFHIEVPVSAWPAPPKRLLRVSAHLYNDSSQYEYLTGALTQLLPDSPGSA